MAKSPKKKAPGLSLVAPAALESMRRMHIGVLSVMLKPGQPYSAVVNVHVDDDFHFFLAMNKATRKFKALAKNPNVSFNMGFDAEMVNNFQITGKATIVKNAAHWKELIGRLEAERTQGQVLNGLAEMTAHYPYRHFPQENAAVVMITPSWIRWFRHTPDAKAPVHVMVLGKE